MRDLMNFSRGSLEQSMPNGSDSVLRYGCAVISIALAIWVRRSLDPALGDQFPYATVFFAVLLTAWFGGFGPALAAAGLGALASTYFLLPPRGNFLPQGRDQWVGLMLYMFTSLGIALLGGSMQAARRRAELNAATERRQAALLDQANDAVLVWDWNGPITFWNRAAEKLYGIPRAEALQRVPYELLRTKSPSGVEDFRSSLERHGSWEGELQQTTRDGRSLVVESRMVLVHQGERAYVLETNHDIGERKRAEQERDRFFTLSLDLLCVAGFDGYFKRLNPAWEGVVGWTTEELLSKPFLEFVHPDDREATIREVQNQQRGEAVLSFMNRYRCKDGSYRWLSWKSIPVEKESLMYGAARDITKHKEAEERLRASEERFRGLLEAAPDAVLLVNAARRIVFVNARAEKMFGYRREELLGQLIEETVVPERFHDKHVGHHERYFSNPSVQMDSGLDLYARRKDGSEFPVDLKLNPLETEQGVLAITIVRDVTDRKHTEEGIRRLNEDLGRRTAELEVTNKDLEAFTYSVSHDLRAPLRRIDGFAQLLVEDYGAQLPPAAQDYLGRVRAGTRHMGLLVDELLSLARIGRQSVKLQITGLDSIVKEVISDLKGDAAGRDIHWNIQPLPFVECDPGLTKVVFTNLLSNAIKYTRPRQRAIIDIGCGKRDGVPYVFVRDNGVGFSMKYADKLFGAFQRLHRAEDFEGTGIGLATVQRIVHKHGGSIWAEAEVDQGACFHFTLQTQRVTSPQFSPAPGKETYVATGH